MADSATPTVIRALAKAELLAAYPYMPIAAIDELLVKLVADTTTTIEKQKPVMAEIKSRVNFFSLPAELRNVIYELAVTPGKHSEVPEPVVIHGMDLSWYKRLTLPAILHTSQQVRQEALPLYFGLNTFQINVSAWLFCMEDFDSSHIHTWVQLHGDRVSLVKKLQVHITLDEDDKKFFGDAIGREARATPQELNRDASVQQWNKGVLCKGIGLSNIGFPENLATFCFA